MALDSSERKKKGEIDLALSSAIDDMALRLKSDSFMDSYTDSVASGERELTVKGESDDLITIYIIKIATGSDQIVLESKDKGDFLKNHDVADATSGKPTMYSVVKAEDGFPVIRFDKPTDQAYSLLIYYSKEMTTGNISNFRFMTPFIDGTLAYFLGVGSTRGRIYYANFEKKVALMKGSDDFEKGKTSKFAEDNFVKEVRSTQREIMRKRY